MVKKMDNIRPIKDETEKKNRNSGVRKNSVTPAHVRETFLMIIILLISSAVYLNALGNVFVYDDTDQVLKNNWIKDTKFIPEIFSKNVWSFQADHSVTNYYRPMMHLIYMLNYHLFGLAPWGFHLVNILFHAFNSVLVFLLIRLLADRQAVSPGSEQERISASTLLYSPFIAAILFATHPIHTEAVTWVAGVPELSFTFFCLLSFYFYIRAAEALTGAYIFSVISFFLAVFCKETALTLLPLLFIYDCAFGRSKEYLSYLKKYIPYISVGIVYLILRFHALGGLAPDTRHAELSSYQNIINVFPLFGQYIEKLLLPLKLKAFYVLHPITSIFEPRGLLSLIMTSVYIVLVFIMWRKSRVVFLGLMVFLIPLLPVLYIPGLGENTFTERYLYLPSLGFAIVVSSVLIWARTKLPNLAVGLVVASALVIGLYSVGTIKRNAVWKDMFTLLSDTVAKSPDSFIDRNNLGNIFMQRGEIDEAITQYNAALTVNPDYFIAHSNLGAALFKKGLIDKAIGQYQIALRLMPTYAEAYNHLGIAYGKLGLLDMAIGQFQTAVYLKPAYADAHYNLGKAYTEKGLLDEAIKQYESALKLEPDDPYLKSVLDKAYQLRIQR
jgi:tetratricopeptide (TPR) repeat protein